MAVYVNGSASCLFLWYDVCICLCVLKIFSDKENIFKKKKQFSIYTICFIVCDCICLCVYV